jgi:hypothetical protein
MFKSLVRRSFCAAVILPLITACSDFVAPPETDPNAVPDADEDLLFVAHEANLYFWYGAVPARFSMMWMQQMGGVVRQSASLELYQFTDQSFNTSWEPVYEGGGLIDLRKALARTEARGDRVYSGVLQVSEALVMGTAADLFGDIPYSQATDPEIDEPVLDEQTAVYAALQSLLSEAIANLESGERGTGAPALETSDFNFSGDATSWIKAAHSLKARLHLHMVELEGDSRYSQALAEAEQGIDNIAGNWTQKHTTSSVESNSWFNFEDQRTGDMRGNAFLINMMNGGTPSDFTDDDPRTSTYWAEADDGGFLGHTTGVSNPALDPLDAASWLNVPGEADFPQPILTCTETQFIIAEAQSALGNDAAARAAAKDALACQESWWSLQSGTSIDLSDNKAAFDEVSGPDLFDLIMKEKFIGLFLNPELWNDWKRTCSPMRSPAPGSSEIVGRFLYAQQERQTNSNIPESTDQPARNDNDPNACPPS